MISTLEKEITFRYLKTRKKDGFLNIISIFSFIGISLGVAVLIIVMSVMNGFRSELINKIVGFNAHIFVKPYENAIDINNFSISPQQLVELITIIEEGKISNTVATSKVLPIMLKSNKSANQIAIDNNWIQESDSDTLEKYIKQAIDKYPEKVNEYKSGKKGLIGLFMGEVMKLSKGQADPKLANQMLKNELEK